MTSLSLPVRAKALRARLQRVNDLASKAEEARRLDELRSELARPVAKLGQRLSQRAVLVSAQIPASLPASVDAPRRRATALLEKFKEDPSAATLNKGRNWTQLLADAEAATAAVETSTTTAWRAWVQNLFGGDKPSAIRGRLAPTPENTKALQSYERLYEQFRQSADAPPPDPAGALRLKELAQQLTQTAQTFDFNVQPEVKAFLEAVQAGGAPLSLLTDEVRRWLADRQATDDYCVRAIS